MTMRELIRRGPEDRATVMRYCRECGRQFYSRAWPTNYCTRSCQMRAWRAVVMLAGTHGYVNGRFTRLVAA